MSELKKTERIEAAPAGPGRGPMGGGQVAQKAMSFGPSAKRLLRRMRPDRVKLVGVVALAAFSVALTVVGPKVLGKATDLIFAGLIGRQMPASITKEQAVAAANARGETKVAQMLSGVDFTPGKGVDFVAVAQVLQWVLLLYLGAALLSWLQGYLLNDVVQQTVFRMRRDVEEKVNRLPLDYFDKQPRGELLSRVTNDIDNLGQSLQQTLSQMVTSLLTVVGVLAMMLAISWQLGLIALLMVPVSMLIASRVMKRSQGNFVQQWRRTGSLNALIEESFSGHALVKVYGRQGDVEQRFANDNEELYAASFAAQFVSGLIMPIMMLVGNINYVIVAVVGGLKVASGTMSIGDVQAFIMYSRQFTQPITQVASMVNLLQSGVASAERVFEVLDAEEEPDPAAMSGEVGLAARARGEVRFENVSFSYDPQRPLIDGLDLVAKPGRTVAIVGPTGAGKTTLVNLILRFYELNGGRILLDGADITSMTRAQLRSQIGMVLQDAWLFEGSIRDNIAYGSPDADDEQIINAAKATFVDRFVHSLPEGYDTLVDEQGSNLSAGERQLITIARAFLADPPLLILDEATSAVDTRTELLVQQAMSALRSDRTSFVIAHRLSTIRDADVILVMADGVIVEQGNHDQLLAADGAYARLYRSQFEAPVDEAV